MTQEHRPSLRQILGAPEFVEPKQKNERHLIESNDFLRLPLDAPAIDTITTKDGDQVDVIAKIRSVSGHNATSDFEPAKASWLVIRDARNNITFRVVTEFDKTIDERRARVRFQKKPKALSTRTGAPNLEIAFTPPTKRAKKATLNIAPNYRDNRKLQIITSSDAGEVSGAYENIYTVARDNAPYRLRRRAARVAMALSGAFMLDSGSGLDMALDPFNDAGAIVREAFPSQNADQKAAVDRVAATMQDLDDHKEGVIAARAEQFKQQYKDQLMPEAKVADFQKQIETASSHEQIIKVVDEFMGFYGKGAVLQQKTLGPIPAYQPSTPTKLLRDYALGVLDAYSFLPKDYIAQADFTKLQFGGENEKAGGLYSHGPDGKLISISVIERDFWEIGARQHAAETALHEMGHADQILSSADSHTDLSLKTITSFALKELMSDPEYISLYAAHNPGSLSNEQYAEAQQQLLAGGEDNGLTHPDRTRMFASEASRKLLNELIALERRFKGITDYIVQRAGTANKSGIRLFS